MSRSVWGLTLTIVIGFAMTGAVVSVSAQDTVPAHPSHIHPGTCAELDPNPEYPLTDVTSVAPDAPVGAVEVGHSTVDVTIDELLASPYAINVHESAENAANYIACGDVAGPVVDGLLLIPLYEQNESGYSGIAALGSDDAGGTNVSVYIAPGLHGDADTATVATPVVGEAEVVDEVAATDEVVVPIVDFAFDPQVLEIPVGTTVTWINEDSAPHTSASTEQVWDSDILNQGESYSFTFEEAGTYDYICGVHPSMTGQVVVTDQ